jgi:DNA-binding NarL/FixJ family response regulator
MMSNSHTAKMSVLCVDDNAAVAEALEVKLGRSEGFEWKGALRRADDLVAVCVRDRPTLVLLDVDMPGRDPFDVLAELVDRCPETRVLVFSGHVRRDLITRAIDSGAWGYVSKNDGEEEMVAALRQVAAGELALSPEAKRMFGS